MMRWEKRGLVYVPPGNRWWARTHAFMPTIGFPENGLIRVYFAALDDKQYGRIGYVDLDAQNPSRVIRDSEKPVLDIGRRGTFDDCGVNASCLLNVGDQRFLYYIGWQRAERVPYMLFSGLAISSDGGNQFERHSPVPVLDRTPSEPFSRSAPFVLWETGIFKMWYWSCQEWSEEDGWVHYNNVIRYAESTDGVTWRASEDICLAPRGGDYSIGRPWVIHEHGIYRMWYSIRSRTHPYRIGYAESPDGTTWTRKDETVGIDRSRNGWDSEMICFPCIVDVAGRRYMFYNGNRHGGTGFGYAELVQDR